MDLTLLIFVGNSEEFKFFGKKEKVTKQVIIIKKFWVCR